jgi:hypothetical protein
MFETRLRSREKEIILLIKYSWQNKLLSTIEKKTKTTAKYLLNVSVT